MIRKKRKEKEKFRQEKEKEKFSGKKNSKIKPQKW